MLNLYSSNCFFCTVTGSTFSGKLSFSIGEVAKFWISEYEDDTFPFS